MKNFFIYIIFFNKGRERHVNFIQNGKKKKNKEEKKVDQRKKNF